MTAEDKLLVHIKEPKSLLDKISEFNLKERLTSQINHRGGIYYEFFADELEHPSIVVGVDVVRGQHCIYTNSLEKFTTYVKKQNWAKGFLVPYQDDINLDESIVKKVGLRLHLDEISKATYVFSSIGINENEILERVLAEKGLTVFDNPEVYDVLSLKYDNKEKKIEELKSVIGDCNLYSISEAEAEIVNSFWSYRSSTSLIYMTWTAKNSLTSCIKTEEGDMTSWMIQYTDGNIGALFTPDKYRNKGYARKVSADMIIKVLERNEIIPYVFIKTDNVPSLSLFKSLGFEKHNQSRWLMAYNPQNENPSLPKLK